MIPVHSFQAVATNKFYLVGKMMTTCLIQGGQPPLCFARAVADVLIFGNIKSAACLEDIPDYDVREKLKQVVYVRVNKIFKGAVYVIM